MVDYEPTAEDHQSLLVLVSHHGPSSPSDAFNHVWERMLAGIRLHIDEHDRDVTVRYVRRYSPENTAWGEFQAHRSVLGVVSVATDIGMDQLADVIDEFEKVSVRAFL